MACVLVTVIVLAEDWNLGIGLNWRPLVFGAERMPNVPWKSTVVGFAIGLIAMRIPARRGPPGICASCGYNLTGNASGVCPECGTTIPAPTIPA